eukprot:1156280-Pelagomonas_calceolata.AAC.6
MRKQHKSKGGTPMSGAHAVHMLCPQAHSKPACQPLGTGLLQPTTSKPSDLIRSNQVPPNQATTWYGEATKLHALSGCSEHQLTSGG